MFSPPTPKSADLLLEPGSERKVLTKEKLISKGMKVLVLQREQFVPLVPEEFSFETRLQTEILSKEFWGWGAEV